MENGCILVVDDDPQVLAYYRKLLSGPDDGSLEVLGSPGVPGSAVRPALTCEAFLDPLELLAESQKSAAEGRRHPVCVIDMRMPALSGLATAIRLREIDPDINIVICTAFSDIAPEEIRAKLGGGVFFVSKPFVAGEFLLLIQSLVGHWNTEQEHRRTRASLAGQCEKLSLVLEGTRVGTWEWDIPTGKLELNERWAEIVGHDLRELQPLDISVWKRLCHPDDLLKSTALLEKVFSRELPYYDCECRMLHKSGGWVWVWDRGKVTSWSPEGRPLRMSGTHSDITERRQAEDLRGQLLAMASHEFRTPLATIRLGADLLASRRDRLDEVRIQAALECITKAANQMARIVTDVLDFNSAGSDSVGEVPSAVSLADFLRQAVADFRAAQPAPIEISLEGDGSTVIAAALPSLLARVVNNLLDNAVKFSPDRAPVVLGLSAEEGMAVIRVEDRGIGVPGAESAFVNTPFYRASNTRGIPGTGLGLAIVTEAMRRMGGSLAHAARAGGGSVFTVRLPLSSGRPPRVSRAPRR